MGQIPEPEFLSRSHQVRRLTDQQCSALRERDPERVGSRIQSGTLLSLADSLS